MPITLLLDLDDTLLNTNMDAFIPAYFQTLSCALADVVAPELMLPALMGGTKAMLVNKDPALTLREVFDAYFFPKLGMDRSVLQGRIDCFYDEDFPKLGSLTTPIPEAVRLVDWALEQGHRVVIATNPLFPLKAVQHRLRWAGLPPEKYPFALVTSYENMHFTKETVAYYPEILAQLGWPEDPAVMVGDDIEREVKPTRAAGLPVYWVRKTNGVSEEHAQVPQGTMILRIEDTDQARFVPGAEDYIVESLKWVGIDFDEGTHIGGPYAPYRQSDRKAMYRQYADQLLESGNAYYAFDTTEDLDAMRDKLKAGGMAPQYDSVSRMSMKNSLTLSEDDVKSRLDAGEPYVIRIKLPRKEEVRFHDLIRGWVVVQTSAMDDKVLFKSDGMPTYHLANVVDDYTMKITHVIRGEEWLPSAPLHVMLYKFFGWEEVMPKFAHLPLILKPDGNGKLSKRDGDRLGFPVFPMQWKDPSSGEISSGYKDKGYEPEGVLNMLALLGWHTSDNREIFSLDELIQLFSLEKISKNGAKFDPEKAKWFNHQHLMLKPNMEIAENIYPEAVSKGYQTDIEYLSKVVGLIKEKVTFKNEIIDKCAYFFESPKVYDAQVVAKKWNSQAVQYLAAFAKVLEQNTAANATKVEELFKEVAAGLNMNAGSAMQPLRVALSGESGGPPVFEMLCLIGIEESAIRINKAISAIAVSA